jgi:hypothetical protein
MQLLSYHKYNTKDSLNGFAKMISMICTLLSFSKLSATQKGVN